MDHFEALQFQEYGNNKMYFAPDLIGIAYAQGLETPLETHVHLQYEIYIFHNGDAHYIIDHQVFELEPGMVILLDGTELHRVHVAANEKDYQRSLLHFNPLWIGSLLNRLDAKYLLDYFTEFHHRIFKLNPEQLEEVVNLIVKIEELSSQKVTEKSLAEAKITLMYLLTVIYNIEKTDMIDNIYGKTEKAGLAEMIAGYIKQNFNTKWTIKELARDLNMSESYASHLFKAETGYTIMEYLKEYRIMQAKAFMLLYPDESTIKDCALVCGFESDAHFNRVFKKETGLTPNKYKRLMLKSR